MGVAKNTDSPGRCVLVRYWLVVSNEGRKRVSGGRVVLVKRVVEPDRVSDGRVAVLTFTAVAIAYWVVLPHVDIHGNHRISDRFIYEMMAQHPGKMFAPGRVRLLNAHTLDRVGAAGATRTWRCRLTVR